MDANAWIALSALAFSVAAAVWSWWEANRSKKARKDAEAAASRADRSVVAAEALATQVSELVDRFTPAPLEVTWIDHDNYDIRNTQGEPVEIVELVNAKDFSRRPFVTPVTIAGGEAIRGSASAKYSAGPFPLQAVLKLRGRSRAFVLPFTGRPDKS